MEFFFTWTVASVAYDLYGKALVDMGPIFETPAPQHMLIPSLQNFLVGNLTHWTMSPFWLLMYVDSFSSFFFFCQWMCAFPPIKAGILKAH